MEFIRSAIESSSSLAVSRYDQIRDLICLTRKTPVARKARVMAAVVVTADLTVFLILLRSVVA